VILLIDNYDSFTYNLVQLLLEAGAQVKVVRNDVEDVETLLAREPAGIVLSPGPGRPESAGVCVELLEHGGEVADGLGALAVAGTCDNRRPAR